MSNVNETENQIKMPCFSCAQGWMDGIDPRTHVLSMLRNKSQTTQAVCICVPCQREWATTQQPEQNSKRFRQFTFASFCLIKTYPSQFRQHIAEGSKKQR